MDLNKRDELIEKRNKLNKSLKSTYATLLKENWAMAQEADSEAAIADVPPVDVDTPEVAHAASPEGDEPVSDEQAKMSTTDFATKYLKTLPSDVDMTTAVNDQGIFNASVNDDQNGQYMVVVFPATKNIREVADILSPVDPAVPTDAAALPPVSNVPPTDAASALPPVEEVKEAACETDCEDDTKMNESDNEGFYAEKERQRDPMSAGRKNWKSMQESAKKKINESEDEKLKKRLENIEKLLKSETDEEEKEALKKDIAKIKGQLSSKKISDHSKAKAADSFKNYDHGKDD